MHREVTALETLAPLGVTVQKVFESNTKDYQDLGLPLYFVMELIEGDTLKSVIQSRGTQSLDKAAALVIAAANVIGAGHAKGVVHRDLKPSNILVRSIEANDVVILDYGLSYDHEQGDGETVTYTDERFHSSFIQLPETNAPGNPRRDARSDVTSLAGLLYYCVTGHNVGPLRDSADLPAHRRKGYSVRESFAAACLDS
jgi:serine/threonine protein kinase